MILSPNRRSTLIALLASSAAVAPLPALAATPAPRFTSIDDHGVDMVLGLPYVTIDEGGIGSGPGAMRMQRIYGAGAGLLDNWTGGLYPITSGSTVKMYIQIGGISDTFSGSGSSWTSDKGDGATLTVDASNYWTYTARDGTVIAFDKTKTDDGVRVNSANNCPGGDADTCQVPLSITKPNSLKFSFTWGATAQCVYSGGDPCGILLSYQRLAQVASSAGYSLQIAYLSNTAGDPNWYTRTGVTFNNSANPPSPTPAIAYAYPSSTVTNVTDPAGRVWVLTADASGRLTGVQRPGSASNNITYAYDATSGLVSSAAKDGVTDTYSVPVTGQYKSTDPLAHATIVTIDTAHGRPSSVKDANNNSVGYLYDSNDRIQRVTQPEGNYVTYGYDARGNAATITNVAKSGSGLANIVTSAAYPASCTNVVTCNKPSSTTDPKANVTDYTYDPTHGGVLTATAPAPTTGAARPQSRFGYTAVTSASGDVVKLLSNVAACPSGSSCTSTAEISRSATYNSNLLPITVTKGNTAGTVSATSAIAYDAHGNVDTVDGPLAGTADTSKVIYDAADQRIGTISPDPDGAGTLQMRAIRLTYRPDGQVLKGELGNVTAQTATALTGMSALQTLDVTFDTNSRAITRKLSASATAYALTQTSYDADGRASCTAQRLNPAVYGSLPASACTLSTQGSDGPDQITSLTYDAVDRATAQTIGFGTASVSTERTLTYSANGQVGSLTDANNNRTSYVYDGFDRLSQTQNPSATKGAGTSNAADYEQLGYDASSNVTSQRLRDATSIAFTYDNLNRATFKNLPGTEPDVTYAYDNLGRLTSASHTGNTLGLTWDALSRLTDQSGNQGTVHGDFDAAGRRTLLTYPDAGLSVNYDWLVTGEVSKIRENGATTGIGVLASYGYDQLGNMTAKTFGNGVVQNYTFDPVSRLASLGNDLSGTTSDLAATLGMTAASQIKSTTRTGNAYPYTGLSAFSRDYVSNGLNQYSSSTKAGVTTTYSYDSRGNLTSDGPNSFTYTSENLLKSGPNSSTLTYDPLARLYQLTSGAATTRFSYDGLNLLAEYNASNALQRRYVFAPGLDAPVVWYEGTGTATRRFMSADERGSIISVSDASGAALSTNGYDEYGIPQSPASASAGMTGVGTLYGRFGYTGQAWLPEIGVYYYKTRMYSPTLGRFMQADPIGYADGANWYAYVGNDPVNWVDPLGLCNGQLNSAGAVEICGGGTPGAIGPGAANAVNWVEPSAPREPKGTDEPQSVRLPCSAANQSGKGVIIKMGLTNTPVSGLSHAFVVAIDPATGDSFASRAGPGSGPGGGFALGLTATSGPYGKGFPDYGGVTGVVAVGAVNVSYSQVTQYMTSFAATTNANNLVYGGLVQNSNSYAAALLAGMGFTPPPTGKNTPGYNSNSPDPSMVCSR